MTRRPLSIQLDSETAAEDFRILSKRSDGYFVMALHVVATQAAHDLKLKKLGLN
jgi:hypothetical protein